MVEKSEGLLPRDRARLAGVHPALVAVVEAARAREPFIVVEGLRTPERQRELVARGASQTLASKHLVGRAVDLAPWADHDRDGLVDFPEVDWKDTAGFRRVAEAMEAAARALGVGLVWGGRWKTLVDMPHFELANSVPPALGAARPAASPEPAGPSEADRLNAAQLAALRKE